MPALELNGSSLRFKITFPGYGLLSVPSSSLTLQNWARLGVASIRAITNLAASMSSITIFGDHFDRCGPSNRKSTLLRRVRRRTKFSANSGENLRTIVIGALNTGFRRAELLSLTWQDVDFERGLVTVQAAYAKNREKRSIPINRRLRAVLQSLKPRGANSARFS
jgi:integrase